MDLTEPGEKIGCIPEATIAGIPVDKTPMEDFTTVDLPPPGTSVVAFISKLYELVNNPDTQNFISWSDEFNKKAIIIPDPVEFSKQILPKFFKHSNICSFVRQLNIYGFRKLETQTGFCFRHESFIADHPELLPNIQRKKPTPHRKKQPTTTEDDSTSLYQYLLTQLVQLQKQNTETQTQINTLKEMLYQLKLREDTLEMKLYRLSEIVMPSLNYSTPMFGQNLFSQFMNQGGGSTDMSSSFPGSMMSLMMQGSSQMTGSNPQQAQPPQTNPFSQWSMSTMSTQGVGPTGSGIAPGMSASIGSIPGGTQQKPTEEQPSPSPQQNEQNGFVQWDFQSQIPWKF